MKNEQENLEQQEQATQVVTPPPFRPSDEPQEALAPEPPASPTLDDRIAQLGLDESTSNRLSQLAGGLDAASLSPELLSTLARGITHDQDVENADAQRKLEICCQYQTDNTQNGTPPHRLVSSAPHGWRCAA